MNMRAYEGDIVLTRVGMFYEVSSEVSTELRRKIIQQKIRFIDHASRMLSRKQSFYMMRRED